MLPTECYLKHPMSVTDIGCFKYFTDIGCFHGDPSYFTLSARGISRKSSS